ncbi:MAG TPA: glycosyltransferase [Gordonia sp. (in: high G+C Gram-positive bacteria)]|uniref:glycosyltransferase n=1 Tax=unclassified Gordonia (in: high G+C Gram-positive bacteria) TaxID=2657482 RepID=UPI000F9E9F5C|nr:MULTISPECIES: glycosyltransferase [unclassified Gordonia (in: high G+C Gram-positive bacteria)]RUP36661.1 MAG: glycosyltransferase [Gordonia sp. (in: high G+C Gram-positive bacteria)]HNP57400.1 glycosyltransferase [Gordonia sp. (in: high G+C Gram-positive bacteria)]HRC50747.1 glycosyltransferase [Gordonia sp. (in: high G+C Gram-positive bacteria)]
MTLIEPVQRTAAQDYARPRTRPHVVAAAADAGVPVLDVVVPVFNEQAALSDSIRRLHGYLLDQIPFTFAITVADNASTDRTPAIAAALAREIPEVRYQRLEFKGRGAALHHAWSSSDAPVLAYMDVDLSTDLAAVLPLIAPLVSGHSDIAIGTRLSRSARVVRGPKREIISRCYNLILRSTLSARFSDAQCGFKAIRADAAAMLLPHVADTGWFFDTELLVLAHRCGLRIHEVPVDWIDDPDSSVDIVATAVADLLGVARLVRGFATGAIPIRSLTAQFQPQPDPPPPPSLLRQVVYFATVGVLSTVAFLALFLVLRDAWGPQVANFTALLVTAVANTAANRRFTFGVRGRDGVARHQAQGIVVFGIGLALTSGALALLHLATDPPRAVEVAVLVLANLAATVVRFVLLRGWVFRSRHTAGAEPVTSVSTQGDSQ